MSEGYKLAKWAWDDSDFDRMGWHDATIHGLAFGPDEFELSLDIDYIFEWVHPAEGEECFRFWVAPCTLVFQNVYDLHLEGEPRLSVDDLRRTEPRKPTNAEFVGRDVEWRWTFECHNGALSFQSVGYKQFVRRAPVLIRSQVLNLQERGGFSFESASGGNEETGV